MFALYIILGALASISILYGIAWERLRRGRWKTPHWISLALVALAWMLEHTSLLGQICMLAAIALEVFIWYGRTQRESGDLLLEGFNDAAELDRIEAELAGHGGPEALAPEAAEAIYENEEVMPPSEAEPLPPQEDLLDQQPIGLFLRTLVLLRNEYRVAPQVLLASLRRAGQRDATPAEVVPNDATAALVAGELRTELRTSREPADATKLEMALSQAENRDEALALAEDHARYLEITTLFHMDTPRDAIVRCQHRIHAAIAEFAPVVGVLWPSSARLTPARQLAALQRMANGSDQSMLKTCTSLRAFSLEGSHAGFVLTDTMGLHVFGLPDLQVITEGPPDPVLRGWLADLAERFYQHGCDLSNQSEISFSETDVWRVTFRRSAFAPDREVVQIAPRREAPGTWGGSWEVHASNPASMPDAAPELGGGWGA